jgi:DNA-binding HxlR family transcriptional regulator
MANRAYGQYCGLAKAVEMLCERWGLLIVRDLLVEPKRFTDLQRGRPGIPTNVLTARLKELEQAGVIQRRLLPRPSGAVVYELTKYGAELEEIVVRLGRWGAKSLGDPSPGEIVTADSMVMAMRSTFRPEAARRISATFELRMGPVTINVAVKNATVRAAQGALPGADLIIEAGPGIRALMAGEVTADEAIRKHIVRVKGDKQLLARFAEMFRIDPKPMPSRK